MSAHIALIKGDGIGADVCDATTNLVNLCLRLVGETPLAITEIDAGAAYFQETGTDIEAGGEEIADKCDAIFLGAIGLPSIRHTNGTEISPHLRLRERFQLYAGVRPVKAYPNIPQKLADPRAASRAMSVPQSGSFVAGPGVYGASPYGASPSAPSCTDGGGARDVLPGGNQAPFELRPKCISQDLFFDSFQTTTQYALQRTGGNFCGLRTEWSGRLRAPRGVSPLAHNSWTPVARASRTLAAPPQVRWLRRRLRRLRRRVRRLRRGRGCCR